MLVSVIQAIARMRAASAVARRRRCRGRSAAGMIVRRRSRRPGRRPTMPNQLSRVALEAVAALKDAEKVALMISPAWREPVELRCEAHRPGRDAVRDEGRRGDCDRCRGRRRADRDRGRVGDYVIASGARAHLPQERGEDDPSHAARGAEDLQGGGGAARGLTTTAAVDVRRRGILDVTGSVCRAVLEPPRKDDESDSRGRRTPRSRSGRRRCDVARVQLTRSTQGEPRRSRSRGRFAARGGRGRCDDGRLPSPR